MQPGPLPARKPYPSDRSDEEWAFVAPYLTLVHEDAVQWDHPLREAFDGLRNGIATRLDGLLGRFGPIGLEAPEHVPSQRPTLCPTQRGRGR